VRRYLRGLVYAIPLILMYGVVGWTSDSKIFAPVAKVRSFVDPENEILVLVEGERLGTPETFARLQDFQFELQFIDGVGSVYSPFALRDPPLPNGNAPLVIRDVTQERGYSYPELARQEGLRSLVSVPLLIKDNVIGVFNLYTSQERQFSNEEIQRYTPPIMVGVARR
jgi:GAF domain-containing protein